MDGKVKEIVIRIEPKKKGFILQILDKQLGSYILYYRTTNKITFESKIKTVPLNRWGDYE